MNKNNLTIDLINRGIDRRIYATDVRDDRPKKGKEAYEGALTRMKMEPKRESRLGSKRARRYIKANL